MRKDINEVLITEAQIAERVRELGQMISADYQGNPLYLIGILKGAVPFIADLMRAIDHRVVYDLMAVSSYGSSTQSSGTVRILKDVELDIEGQDVMIVEDIIDTGLTLQYLKANLQSRKVRSMKICALLDKPSRRVVNIHPDYFGFKIPDVFVIGYGLDYAEQYRNLPFIGVFREQNAPP